jgi:hypothetical protein
MITIGIESADGHELLGTFELALGEAVFPAGVGLQSQAAQVPSSKVRCKLPRSPWINWRMVAAFVSRTDSIGTLPVESKTAAEIVA